MDPENPLAFSGLETFRNYLREKKGIQISRKNLYYILRQIPQYVSKIKLSDKFERRTTKISGSDLWWSVDLCFFKKHSDIFLVAIDVFNQKIFSEPLASKAFADVSAALEKMFKENDNVVPEKIESDSGIEFTSPSMKEYLKKKGIYQKLKRGSHKAYYAENAIGRIKKKVFAMADARVGPANIQDAVKLAVKNLNLTPSKRLGGMTPASIDHKYDDPQVREEREKAVPESAIEPWRQQAKNQENYEKDKKNPYQVGALVYLVSPGRLQFQKTRKKGELFRIEEVRAYSKPPLYKLSDLSGTPLKQWFYRREFQFANFEPGARIFTVEKILGKRKNQKTGKEQLHVKYKYLKQLYVSLKTIMTDRKSVV